MQQFQRGDIIGKMEFIREIEPVKKGKNKIRLAWFVCPVCGNGALRAIYATRHGNSKSCGCNRGGVKGRFVSTHGFSQHPLYGRWLKIKNRCYNPDAHNYKWYGGIGRKMYDEWKNNFKAFCDYVVSLPDYGKHGYTLDRINNGGDYEPGNMRWADQHTQGANSSVKSSNTSGYAGVSKREHGWRARIGMMNKRISLGTYVTPEAAVAARNQYIIDNKLFEYAIQ